MFCYTTEIYCRLAFGCRYNSNCLPWWQACVMFGALGSTSSPLPSATILISPTGSRRPLCRYWGMRKIWRFDGLNACPSYMMDKHPFRGEIGESRIMSFSSFVNMWRLSYEGRSRRYDRTVFTEIAAGRSVLNILEFKTHLSLWLAQNAFAMMMAVMCVLSCTWLNIHFFFEGYDTWVIII